MKKYEKIALLNKQLLRLKDDLQLHTADLAGWDTRIQKATLQFQARQLEYDEVVARKQELKGQLEEQINIVIEKIDKLEEGKKEDVRKRNARKTGKKAIETTEEEKEDTKKKAKKKSKKKAKEDKISEDLQPIPIGEEIPKEIPPPSEEVIPPLPTEEETIEEILEEELIPEEVIEEALKE